MLHTLWHAKRAGRAMPARADFEIEEFRPWMGRAGLIDVLPDALADGADFRYRLVGTALVAELQCDPTGRCVSDISLTKDIDRALANLRAIVANARPRWRGDMVVCVDGSTMTGERIYLPLSTDGASVDMILFHVTKPRLADGSPAPRVLDGMWSQIV
jgi:hypothetical protein